MNRRSFLAALLAAPVTPVIASKAMADDGYETLSLSDAEIGTVYAGNIYDPRRETYSEFMARTATPMSDVELEEALIELNRLGETIGCRFKLTADRRRVIPIFDAGQFLPSPSPHQPSPSI